MINASCKIAPWRQRGSQNVVSTAKFLIRTRHGAAFLARKEWNGLEA